MFILTGHYVLYLENMIALLIEFVVGFGDIESFFGIFAFIIRLSISIRTRFLMRGISMIMMISISPMSMVMSSISASMMIVVASISAAVVLSISASAPLSEPQTGLGFRPIVVWFDINAYRPYRIPGASTASQTKGNAR